MKQKPSLTPSPGDHLRSLVRLASFGGLFISLIGSFVIWAGTDAFNCSPSIWKSSLETNVATFLITWATYIPFKNTNRLLGHGLISTLILFSLFWLFGFAMFYFYFLFAPMNFWTRAIILTGFTTMLLYRAFLIINDIKQAFQDNQNLFSRIYFDNGTAIFYDQNSFALLQEARRKRNPFKSFHAYAAIVIAPFFLAVNRITEPFVGEGHGVFMVSAFFSAPILLWAIEIFVQTIVTTIYYPIKLYLETGKPVLMKN
ncbi:hypothetical protein [Massilia sp. 9096]|uniref:hypothetical protein n=1 Tax=Massilia sp. 9096 TaxID=1500894 RepID=UPI0012E07040|nr:hypothetical protein [Massilia sp. 9096]